MVSAPNPPAPEPDPPASPAAAATPGAGAPSSPVTGKMVGQTEKRAVLWAATLGAFITPFILSSLTVALPDIGREFSLSAVALGWVSTAYLLTTGAMMIPFGSVGDRYGRKKVFVIGMVIIVVSSGLSALAPSFGWLLAARCFQGVGASMTFSTMTAMLTSVYGLGERGRVLGINVAAVYIGLSIGPVVGGLMTERLGWRSLFAVPFVASVIVIAVVLGWVKHEWSEPRHGRFDYGGALLYAVGLVALMWGLSQIPGVMGACSRAPGYSCSQCSAGGRRG